MSRMQGLWERFRTARVIRAAAQWHTRARSPELKHRDALARWLARSPRHLRAFRWAERVDAELTALLKDSEAAVCRPPRRLAATLSPANTFRHRRVAARAARLRRWRERQRSGGKGRRGFVAGALTLVPLVVGASLFHEPTYATGEAERMAVTLSDGSKVHLNRRSQIRVAFSPAQRLILLDRGEALFEVEHDAARPFRVLAHEATAQALGTTFAVAETRQNVRVSVIAGRVAVSRAHERIELVNGEEAAIEAGRVARSAISRELLKLRTAWATGRVLFEGETLGAIVEAMNAINETQLVLDQPTLSQFRLGGMMLATDADTFAASLEGIGFRADLKNEAGRRVLHLSRAGGRTDP